LASGNAKVSLKRVSVPTPLALSSTTPDSAGGFEAGCAVIWPVPSFSTPFCCVKLIAYRRLNLVWSKGQPPSVVKVYDPSQIAEFLKGMKFF
jgi:hypothetical protein